ncbi:hypothetical protein [Thermodesulfovibrio sp. TK110]
MSHKDSPIYVTNQATEKVTNLFEAISNIEYTAASESSGQTIDSEFFTTKQWVKFVEVGIKASLVSGLFTALMSPIMMGVFEKIIPVFGSYSTSIVDEIYIFFLSIGFSIGYAIFISKVGKFWRKKYSITRSKIKSLLFSLTVGSFIKAFLIFLLFHYIYVKLTPETIDKIAFFFDKGQIIKAIVHIDSSDSVRTFLTEFRKVFIPASYFVVFTSFLFVVISWRRVIKNILIEWLYGEEELED